MATTYTGEDENYSERPNQATLRYSTSSSPTDLWYNAGGGGSWVPLTEDILASDPNMRGSFSTGLGSAAQSGFEQDAYRNFAAGLAPETRGLIEDPIGSYHSVATEVPGGSEGLNKLLGSMFDPKAVLPPTTKI